MSPEQEALVEVIRALEGQGIPHMVTGSVASSYHGRPRSTHDADTSPEDTVLSKLEWAKKAGRSEKQIDDVAGVLAVNPELDRPYVEKWARELGVLDLWQEIAGEKPVGD